MSLVISPAVESALRKRAEEEGVDVDTYLTRLVQEDERTGTELENLALEGLESGPAIEPTDEFWEARRTALEMRLKQSSPS